MLSVGTVDAATIFAPRSIVSTISGSGLLGIKNGPATSANYVLPTGVAVAPDGTIIVADAGANQIRRITNGVSSLVAGKATPLYSDAESWSGGYADGPSTQAVFNRPVAVAVDREGSIFVADNGNARVREISHGRVSTIAPDHKFGAINGIAVDDDGLLYVAEAVEGVERINADGTITRLHLGAQDATLGLSVRRFGEHTVVAFSGADSIHIAVDGVDHIVKRNDSRMPAPEGVPIFGAWGIVLINENTVAVTDVITNVVRLIRLPALPFLTEPESESIAGQMREEPDYHGGFRDGTSSDAIFAIPRGIALAPNGDLIIADSGNRRIRRIAGADFRGPVLPDFSNYSPDPAHYDILMIGQSFLFSNVLWPDSIPGRVEAYLNVRRASLGIKRPVHVDAIRADGMGEGAMFSLISSYAEGSEDVKVVTLLITTAGPFPVDDLVVLNDRLRKQGIELLVGVLPLAHDLSISEWPLSETNGLGDARSFRRLRLEVDGLAGAYRAAGIDVVPLVEHMTVLERQPIHYTMFNTADYHLAAAGQAAAGEAYAMEIAALHPWIGHVEHSPATDLQPPVKGCANAPALPPNHDYGNLEKASDLGAVLAANGVVATGNAVTLSGWAADRGPQYGGRPLCLLVDGRGGISAHGGHRGFRFDMVDTYLRPELAASGFTLVVDPGSVPPGQHLVGVGVVGGDGAIHTIMNPLPLTFQ